MKTKLCALLISSSIMTTHSFAEDEVDFFDNKESSRYNTEQLPYQTEHDNRFDDEPILSVKKFNLSSLPDMPLYGVLNSDLESIVEESIEDNKGRFTIDRLNRLTTNLTQYYRDKGLLLARTYIPEQNIKNKTVNIAFVDGTIDEVTTTTIETTKTVSELYKHDILTRPFLDLVESPSYRPELESAIIRLSNYPGMKAETRFTPGDRPGTTKLNIKIKHEKKFDGYLNFDNFGSEYTGNYRVKIGGDINNISGNADQLTLGLMATIDPTNSFYGNINYQVPINASFNNDGSWSWLNPVFKNGFTFDTGVQQNTYSIGRELEDLKIKGEATTFYYRLNKPFILNSQNQFTTSLRLDLKKATSKQKNITLTEDKLTTLSLANVYTFTDYLYNRASSSILLDIQQGLDATLGSMENGDINSRQGQDTGYAPADFTKYKLEFSRLQEVDSYQIFAKVSYQHSDDLLVPLEQITLGGPFGVRGYTSADYNADTAFQTTIEIVGKSYAEKLSLPIDQLTAALFLDYGIGWRNDALANEVDSEHLLAVGWYADFVKEEKFQTRMQMGLPLSKTKPANGNSVQFYISMQRRF
jgi:hemolysin activation/secretion protein